MRLAALMLTLALASTTPVLAQQARTTKCDVGPVAKTYGGAKWNVFSCADGQSIIIVAAPGSPATPFVFEITRTVDGYDVAGEGTGDRKATDAAYAEVQKFSGDVIRALIQETKDAKKSK